MYSTYRGRGCTVLVTIYLPFSEKISNLIQSWPIFVEIIGIFDNLNPIFTNLKAGIRSQQCIEKIDAVFVTIYLPFSEKFSNLVQSWPIFVEIIRIFDNLDQSLPIWKLVSDHKNLQE